MQAPTSPYSLRSIVLRSFVTGVVAIALLTVVSVAAIDWGIAHAPTAPAARFARMPRDADRRDHSTGASSTSSPAASRPPAAPAAPAASTASIATPPAAAAVPAVATAGPRSVPAVQRQATLATQKDLDEIIAVLDARVAGCRAQGASFELMVDVVPAGARVREAKVLERGPADAAAISCAENALWGQLVPTKIDRGWWELTLRVGASARPAAAPGAPR